MAVDDHGLEVLKKSGEQVTPGDRADYYIKTKVINGVADPVVVTVVEPAIGLERLIYGEANAVPSGVETDVASYTVPTGATAFLMRSQVSGTNIARLTLSVNDQPIDREYTHFGAGFRAVFDFSLGNARGVRLFEGDQVKVKALHGRPTSGDFNANIQVVEL